MREKTNHMAWTQPQSQHLYPLGPALSLLSSPLSFTSVPPYNFLLLLFPLCPLLCLSSLESSRCLNTQRWKLKTNTPLTLLSLPSSLPVSLHQTLYLFPALFFSLSLFSILIQLTFILAGTWWRRHCNSTRSPPIHHKGDVHTLRCRASPAGSGHGVF